MALVTKTLANLFTTTRSGTATRVNAAGLIESVAANTARIDYDPVTLACRGLLIEETRTNLLVRSQEFDNASWTKTSVTVTANAATAPDGTLTAEKLQKTASVLSYFYQPGTASAGTYTFSFFVKTVDATRLYLEAFQASASDYFNLTTGTVSITGGSLYTMTAHGNGWYRCTATKTFGAALTNLTGSLYLDVYGTSATTSSAYFWGAQVELGSFATSHIPTTTAAVTRQYDLITGTSLSPWFNAAAGSLVAQFDTLAVGAGGSAILLSIASNAGGSLNCAPQLDVMPNATVRAVYTNAAGATLSNASRGTYSFGEVARTACAFSSAGSAIALNGAGPTTATTSGTPAPTGINLGGGGSTQMLNGHLRKIQFYPRRLSNTELTTLST